MLRLTRCLTLTLALAALTACDPLDPYEAALAPEAISAATAAADVPAIEAALTELAARVAAERALPGTALAAAYWMGNAEAGAMGGEIFFNNRGNKQIGAAYVPGDPRRNGRTTIGYATFAPGEIQAPAGLTAADVDGAIDRAMATWDAESCSSGLQITKGTFADWVAFDADILHVGFQSLPPGVLGVTFPFVFTNAAGPTDINNDGLLDYAFAFIIYATDFAWNIGANIDLETVALHEAGHGLGQAHFGKLFRTTSNGKFHFAPRAVMNAGYTGIQQELAGTDGAGHCTLFGSWPNG